MRRGLRKILLATPGFQALCRLLTRGHVRAFMYHRFCADEHRDPACVTVSQLREQISFLVENYEVWTPARQLDHLQGGRKVRGCPVVITVDDGYLDFYTFAFPLFREFRVPAVLFVTTGFVDGSCWLWWDRLRFIIDNGARDVKKTSIAGQEYEIDLTSARSRERAWKTIMDRCRFLDHDAKESFLLRLAEGLRVALPSRPTSEYSAVSWEQIREMHNAGIQFGAHTAEHPILSRLSPSRARQEIAESRRHLEQELGATVNVFCYPQGGPADFSAEVRSLVIDCGFEISYAAYPDQRTPVDRFALPRYGASGDIDLFKWKLCGAERLGLLMRRLIGRPAELASDYWEGSEEGASRPKVRSTS